MFFSVGGFFSDSVRFSKATPLWLANVLYCGLPLFSSMSPNEEFVRLYAGRFPAGVDDLPAFELSEGAREPAVGLFLSLLTVRTLKKNPKVEPSPSFDATPISPPCNWHTVYD